MPIDFPPDFTTAMNKMQTFGWHRLAVQPQMQRGLEEDVFEKTVPVASAEPNDVSQIGITQKSFGTLKNGEEAILYTLTNKNGASVDLSTFGATITSVRVPDKNGKLVDVTQGYKDVSPYENAPVGHAGGTIGPCANKIGGGRFKIDEKEYSLDCNKDGGKTHCHGGSAGLDIKNWKAEPVKNGLKFSYVTKDGEGGYPGNVKVSVTYNWDDKNRLTVRYNAETDKDTILNLTNHSYFNLDGAENADENSIKNHIVQMPSTTKYTETDELSVPTGKEIAVKGSVLDFSKPQKLENIINSDASEVRRTSGVDHNFCIDGYDGKSLKTAAKVKSENTGIVLTVKTNLPGFQFYTANNLGKSAQPAGKDGKRYEKHSAFCVEPQFYPDAVNKFAEKPILRADETYDRQIVYEFSTEK